MAEDRARIQADIIKESTGLTYDVHRISQEVQSVALMAGWNPTGEK